MDQSCGTEALPKLFEFIDEQTALSPNAGLLLAAEDLLRAAGHFPGSKRPKGWRERVDGFGRSTGDRKYTLRVFKMRDYWFVTRRTSRRNLDFEYLALAFDKVPLCTKTDQEAMRLADHCYPDPGQTIPGCWVPYS
jgi:hypothetical protein